jgi:hypothetical protein
MALFAQEQTITIRNADNDTRGWAHRALVCCVLMLGGVHVVQRGEHHTLRV